MHDYQKVIFSELEALPESIDNEIFQKAYNAAFGSECSCNERQTKEDRIKIKPFTTKEDNYMTSDNKDSLYVWQLTMLDKIIRSYNDGANECPDDGFCEMSCREKAYAEIKKLILKSSENKDLSPKEHNYITCDCSNMAFEAECSKCMTKVKHGSCPWAMQMLLDGHKIREKDWTDGQYIKLVNGNFERQDGKLLNNIYIYGRMHSKLWEIYKEPEETHDWEWALKQLADGKKIKDYDWDEGEYIHVINKDHIFIACEKGRDYTLDSIDFESKNWILHEGQ
jgi:hypothetical protein